MSRKRLEKEREMLHEGHRKRLYEKLDSGSFLHEHERLEILLFNAYPRINTNPIAHELINAFGSLRGVFDASVEQLKSVKGVGDSVAHYIKIVAMVAAKAYSDGAEEIFLKNYGDFKNFTAKRLCNKPDEVLEIYFCEKNGKIKYIFSKTDFDKHGVTLGREEVASLISTHKPFGILIAHNHLTGSSAPSSADDVFTAEVQLLCNINKVTLYDHCIYASDSDVYSYFCSGRIDRIKKEYNLSNILRRN